MKKITAGLIAVCLTVGVLILGGTSEEPVAAQAKKPEPKPDKQKVKELMTKKLENFQLILAALVKNDLDKAAKHAEALQKIRKEAAWYIVKTEQYELWSREFSSSADHLIKAATEKNPDAARLAYLEMTTTCFQCHTYVRDLGDINFQFDLK